MADIYFATTSVGGNTGANCANARAVSSHAIGDDVPGNKLHLCGTFTSGVGAAPFLTMLASGSSGNPITIVFEPNALLQASVFGSNGGIFTNGKTDIVIDGAGTGSNSIGNFVTNGKIQNTANGDQLANQGTIISGIGVTTLINAASCHRCTIKNLELANAYVASPQNAVVNTQNGATGGCTGNCVTRVSGTPFNVNWRTGISNGIKINNVNFTLVSVQSANVLTVSAAPGTTSNQPFSWALGSDMTSMNAIVYNGQFTTVTNNKIHDCGWCLFTNYANNDTAYHVFGNDISNWDHGQMFATAAANNCTNDPTLGCFNFHDNRLHDNVNFETYANQPTLTNCTYHLDGVHFFGNGPGSPNSMDGIYAYNNYFYGNTSGPCSSGFFFMEADSSAQGANAKTCAFWNNVMDAKGADVVWNSGNPNGWFGTFSCLTSNTVVSNTLLYNDILESANATNGFNISHSNSLTFKNNFSSAINMGNNIGSLGGAATVDYNVYSGPPCHLSNNCFIFNGAFRTTFANWKSVSGFDTHTNGTIAAAATLINSDGSPQSGSPLIKQGDNLTSLATGKLATLAFDTTKGGSRTPLARPGGTCPSQGGAGCWDVGAYQFTAGGGSPILGFTPSPANFGTVNIGSSSNLTITVSNTGTASEAITTITITGTNAGDFTNLGTGTCVNGGTIGASLSCTVDVQFAPSALGARTASLNVNGTVNASDTLNGTGATSLIALPAPGPGMFA